MNYGVIRLSKATKFTHYLLTSPELGYKRVEMEANLEANKSADIYIHDIGLSIENDGPPHYFSNTGKRKVSLQDRKTDREVAPLHLSYQLFVRFFGHNVDFTEFKESDFDQVKQQLKALIDGHLKASQAQN